MPVVGLPEAVGEDLAELARVLDPAIVHDQRSIVPDEASAEGEAQAGQHQGPEQQRRHRIGLAGLAQTRHLAPSVRES